MTGHIYRDVILEQPVRLFRGAMGAKLLLMDDNARPHRANIVDECLQSEDITHHAIDLQDLVIRNSNILVLSETWLGNESDISIPNFNCVVKYKRPNTRAGGVAIYQNSSDAVNIITPSMECSVSQSDIYGTIQCLAECVIDNGQKIIIVAVYITPNKKLDDIIEFLHRSLLPYTSRGSALLNKNYDKIPMILSGDFNVNFAIDKSLQLIEFLKDNFTLSLQNNRIISTTKSNTTIDAVFSRYLSDIECKTYISLFSYHKPLITKICSEAPISIMEID
ncbi:ATP-dependent DNA helicase [Trichonephila clavipes]|nr:ATP-dependent DNA helicase [Trichonephila clavipes]